MSGGRTKGALGQAPTILTGEVLGCIVVGAMVDGWRGALRTEYHVVVTCCGTAGTRKHGDLMRIRNGVPPRQCRQCLRARAQEVDLPPKPSGLDEAEANQAECDDRVKARARDAEAMRARIARARQQTEERIWRAQAGLLPSPPGPIRTLGDVLRRQRERAVLGRAGLSRPPDER